MENYNNQNTEFVRVKLPRGKEVIGIIEQRVGARRMEVKCKKCGGEGNIWEENISTIIT